ncbi:hypothetical protein D3C81_2025560 [compost metagenome]
MQAHPSPALRGTAAQPQRAGKAITSGQVQHARLGFQCQPAVVRIALCIQAQLLQALLQANQRQPLVFQCSAERS